MQLSKNINGVKVQNKNHTNNKSNETQLDTIVIQQICPLHEHVFLFSVLCLWSSQYDFMAHIMVFNLWIGPGFIFKPCS